MISSIWEEWKRMRKEKLMIVLLFIIPIAFNILIGIEFQNNRLLEIPMAVVDHDNSSLSRMIVQQFDENDTFSIKYKLADESDLKKLIDKGTVNVGMIIPEGFNTDVTMLKAPNILMIYDGSNMSIASSAKSKASEILLTLKTGVSMKMIGGKLKVPADVSKRTALSVRFSSRFLYNPAKSYKNFLNPGLGTAIVQSGLILLAAVCIKRESLNKGFIMNFGYYCGKIIFYTLGGTIMFLTSVFIQAVIFHIPYKGSVMALICLSFLMALAVSTFGATISIWIRNTAFASLVVAVLFVPSTAMGGYTWPIMAMPKIYQIYGSAMPFAHYSTSLRLLYLKGIPFYTLLGDFRWFICYTLIAFFFGGLGLYILRLPLFAYINKLKLVEEE